VGEYRLAESLALGCGGGAGGHAVMCTLRMAPDKAPPPPLRARAAAPEGRRVPCLNCFRVEGVSPRGEWEWAYSAQSDAYAHTAWASEAGGAGPRLFASRAGLVNGAAAARNAAHSRGWGADGRGAGVGAAAPGGAAALVWAFRAGQDYPARFADVIRSLHISAVSPPGAFSVPAPQPRFVFDRL